MPEPVKQKRKRFCGTQKLSLLREGIGIKKHLSGERFWFDRHPDLAEGKQTESPWTDIDRDELARRLTAAGDIKRLAVVCAGGSGKSTNLEWLEYSLAEEKSRQVPFLFYLDDDTELPANMDEFWNWTLPERILCSGNNRDYPAKQIIARIALLRTQGRITLLLDSIDQATPKGRSFLYAILKEGSLGNCPVVVSARPHAIFDEWKTLIGKKKDQWRFVRVEPLEEEQRKYLLNFDGIDRYGQLPPKGQELMAVPRNIEYVLRLRIKPKKESPSGEYREPSRVKQFTLPDLRTASHVFAGAANYMILRGFKAEDARYLDNPKYPSPPPLRCGPRELKYAHDLLGALAYTMYCFPISAKRKGPNVSHIPSDDMPRFCEKVREKLVSAGVKDGTYHLKALEEDIEALAALNNKIKYDLLDADGLHSSFRWYDRSLQEFFAAYWLSRYAGPTELKLLRKWRYDDTWDTAKKSR